MPIYTKNGATFVVDSNGIYTIKKGSKLAKPSASMRPSNLAVRNANCDNPDNDAIATQDIVCKTPSQCAEIIAGYTGKQWFKGAKEITASSNAVTAKPTAKKTAKGKAKSESAPESKDENADKVSKEKPQTKEERLASLKDTAKQCGDMLASSSDPEIRTFLKGRITQLKREIDQLQDEIAKEAVLSKESEKKQPESVNPVNSSFIKDQIAKLSKTPRATQPKTLLKKADLSKDQIADYVSVGIRLSNFCLAFGHSLNSRYTDTLIRLAKGKNGFKNATDYLKACIKVIGADDSIVNMVEQHTKNAEWKDIVKCLSNLNPTTEEVNTRLEVYFGPSGTGKTTTAENLYPDAVKIVGNPAFDSCDFLSFFDPAIKQYRLSEIGKAYVEGKPIILDEANLFNSAVMAILQPLTDNTLSISDRDNVLTCGKGFKIIVTMNLSTNCGKNPLPEPFVSRAYKVIDFGDLTPEQKALNLFNIR